MFLCIAFRIVVHVCLIVLVLCNVDALGPYTKPLPLALTMISQNVVLVREGANSEEDRRRHLIRSGRTKVAIGIDPDDVDRADVADSHRMRPSLARGMTSFHLFHPACLAFPRFRTCA